MTPIDVHVGEDEDRVWSNANRRLMLKDDVIYLYTLCTHLISSHCRRAFRRSPSCADDLSMPETLEPAC